MELCGLPRIKQPASSGREGEEPLERVQ
jgi:hypothetical protein